MDMFEMVLASDIVSRVASSYIAASKGTVLFYNNSVILRFRSDDELDGIFLGKELCRDIKKAYELVFGERMKTKVLDVDIAFEYGMGTVEVSIRLQTESGRRLPPRFGADKLEWNKYLEMWEMLRKSGWRQSKK